MENESLRRFGKNEKEPKQNEKIAIGRCDEKAMASAGGRYSET